MKRRKFLKNTLIGGFGLTLVPSVTFSKPNFFKTIDIGEVNVHQRHGNLFSSKSFLINHTYLKSIQRDVFYKNGLNQSKEDAFQIKTLTNNNTEHSFFFSPTSLNKVHFFEDMKLFYVDKNVITLFEDDFLIPISNQSKGFISTQKQSLVIKTPYIIITNS